MTVLADVERLLKRTMGLDAASIGSGAVERAVQQRVSACNLADPDAYLERVRTSSSELQELIEAVVVPETWFFRDGEAFTTLARVVHEGRPPTHADGRFRLLSLPCSTGEEPYSMAMALLDAGVPANRVSIDGVDISARALSRARRAVYERNSFRGKVLTFRDRYFESRAPTYHLIDAVRQQVHFQQGNLLASDLLPGVGLYDVVFCRNVLIYFDRATQDRAVDVLVRLLRAEGLLVVGPAETGLLPSHGFVSAKLPLAFALRKGGAPGRGATPSPAQEATRPATRGRSTPTGPARIPTRVPSAAPSPGSARTPTAGVDGATTLANEGRLVEAARACEAYLRDRDPSAQAFHLMGLVRDAAGNHLEAAIYYRKALYLDPNHHEALVHLALLLEGSGDGARAQVLRRRIRRLDEGHV